MTPNDKNTAAMNRPQREEDWQSKNRVSESISSAVAPPSPIVENEIWTITWTVWMRIATAATETTVVESPINPPSTTTTSSGSSTAGTEDRRRHEYPIQQHHQSLQHKQKFLTALLQIFPLIFTRIKARLVSLSVMECSYFVLCCVILRYYLFICNWVKVNFNTIKIIPKHATRNFSKIRKFIRNIYEL